MQYRIRRLEMSDLPGAMRLSREAGWNQTEKDWRMILENPDDVCIAAVTDDLVAGTANAVWYGNRVAWIGMVLVDTRYRRQGIGQDLFSNILAYVNHVGSVRLDATPAGQPLYRKSGFEDDYTIFRMINASVPAMPRNAGLSVRPAGKEDFEFILKKDEEIFGSDRSFILRRLQSDYPQKSFISGRADSDGFVMGREGLLYNYVGPLYALSEEKAESLLAAALSGLKGKAVAIDIPEEKHDLLRWAESLGFVKQRHFTRMFQGSNMFREKTELQYLICGPEFG